MMIKFVIFLLLFSISFSNLSLAQILFSSFEVEILERKANYILTLTFEEPIEKFKLSFLGNFKQLYVKPDYAAICNIEGEVVQVLNCNLNISKEKRSFKIFFISDDVIEEKNSKFLFNNDLSFDKRIKTLSFTLYLPERMVLAEDKGFIFPENVEIKSDGRRIFLVWRLNNIESQKRLKFSLIYEEIKQQTFPFFYVLIFSLASISSASLIIFKYLKKRSEKMILSLLDEFEKKVLHNIMEAGGSIKQKQIVESTGISKAKVSKIIKNLLERGLIEVERIGRTNKIKLKKKLFRT